MNLESWTMVLTVGAAALAAVAIGFAMQRARAQAARAAVVQARIDSAKTELDELRSGRDNGEIDAEAFDAEEKRLIRYLLESVVAMPPAPALGVRFGVRRRVALALTLATLACAAVLISTRMQLASKAGADATPSAAAPFAAASGTEQRPLRALSDAQLERMVAEAGAQVQKTPDDAHAWAMLAHSYDMLGKFAESSRAYANLVRLAPGDAQALADYADALAVANGRSLAGVPTALIERALTVDPKNPKALALAGTAAFERKEYGTAVSFWERARAQSTDDLFKREIEGSIAEAKAAASGGPIGAVPHAKGVTLAGGAVVSGRVSLADPLTAKLSPDATVFIFARPARGSSMPVALLRKRVRDLPVDFTLDDSMSMVPGVTLSNAGLVVVGARVSQRGDVTPQPGDVQGWSAPVEVGTTGIKLEISEVLK